MNTGSKGGGIQSGLKAAVGTWNAATTNLANNASASCTAGEIWVPDGALITKAYYFVQTTFADGNDDSQTLALGYTGATGAFVAAIAISATGTNGVSSGQWDAGIHGTLVGMGANLGADAAHDSALEVIALNAATMIHLTATKELLLTTADDEAVEVGKLSLWVEYVQTGDYS
tara:strand:+ start:5946 stop:6464 length:519 start_codon:yes stop_codon:yes gene_type:complete